MPTAIQCLSHSAVNNLSFVKLTLYKYKLSAMATKRKLCDEDIQSELICDTDSDEYLEDSESDETDDNDDDEEQPSSAMHKQVMKWGLRCQANQMHVHRFTGGDKREEEEESSTSHK
jgi:hypothetical protein